MLRRTLGERIIIETRLPVGVGCVRADPVELDNAILNLAVNARDAMPEGGTLILETANVDDCPWHNAWGGDGMPHVLIAVRDSGTGMDRETMAKAFDPFFTTKGIGRGTGLGLSQVHGFVQQSGGQVLIDSLPGAGTTVRIYLPRLPNDAEEDERALLPEGSNERGSETILVVEDDDGVRAFSTDVLRKVGVSRTGSTQCSRGAGNTRPPARCAAALYRYRVAWRDGRSPALRRGASAPPDAEGIAHLRLFQG